MAVAAHEADLQSPGRHADGMIMSLLDGTREVVDLAWTTVEVSSARPVLFDQDAPDASDISADPATRRLAK